MSNAFKHSTFTCLAPFPDEDGRNEILPHPDPFLVAWQCRLIRDVTVPSFARHWEWIARSFVRKSYRI